MIERRIPKAEIGYSDLKTLLDERLAGRPWSIEQTPTEWIVRAYNDLDSHVAEVQAYGDARCIYTAQIQEIKMSADKPVQVRRNTHSAWCYATAPVRVLLAGGKLVQGDLVLVAFANGNRNMPVVLG